jgi:hypothetical protein
MATRQYTKGLQKLFVRTYGSTLADGSTLIGELNELNEQVEEGDPLPDHRFIDLLEDDICIALVNVTEPDPDLGDPPLDPPGGYHVNYSIHEFLSDIVISGSTDSAITKHSDPLAGKKLIFTAGVNQGVSTVPGDYLEVMFDCDNVTLVGVPEDLLLSSSEAIILYKRVMSEADPEVIDLEKSSLIAYFDGASVALKPNTNNVDVVIGQYGLMRWGVGYPAAVPP